MNREKINKILDNLEIIENYCKKFKPDFELNLRYAVGEYEEIVSYFPELIVDYTETENKITLYFFGTMKEKPKWGRWGTSTIYLDSVEKNLIFPEGKVFIDYLRLLDYIVGKIKKDEFPIEVE